MSRDLVILAFALAFATLAASSAEAQRFVIRGDLGFGYGRGEVDRTPRVEGLGLVWSLAPGVDLSDRFGAHLELWGTSLEEDGPALIVQDDPGRYDLVAGGLGASVLLPLELRLSASAGAVFSRVAQRRAGTASGWGWAASVRLGRTARVGRHASLGASALFSYAHAFDADGPRGFSVGLALSAAFD